LLENCSTINYLGIQGFLLGPVDLSVALGHEGDIDHPEVQAAFKKALDLCATLSAFLNSMISLRKGEKPKKQKKTKKPKNPKN